MMRSGLIFTSSALAFSQKSVGTSPATSQRNPSRSKSFSQYFSMSVIGAQLGISVVESSYIGPVRIRRNDVALCILLVKLRVLHEDAVPCGVVRDDVDDDLEPSPVCFVDEMFKVTFGAVGRIDGVVILNGISAADAALFLCLSQGMDGHDPDHRDAQVFQIIQTRFDAAKVPGRRESARIDFVNHCGLNPVGNGVRGRLLCHDGAKEKCAEEKYQGYPDELLHCRTSCGAEHCKWCGKLRRASEPERHG